MPSYPSSAVASPARPRVELFSQGDEVVTGQVADTNAAWLATQLTELGFDVVRHHAVGDRMADLVEAFRQVEARADAAHAATGLPTLCICTGGLGPTADDLTAMAVAEAFGRPQQLDEVALAAIEARYASFGRRMPEVNRRQAMLPGGVERVDNEHGTAPGFAFDQGACWFVCLPGVPREMKAMFHEQLRPRFPAHFQLPEARLVTFRTTGIGESNLQEAIGPFEEPGAVLSYRTKLPENHIKLRFTPECSAERAQAIVRHIAAAIQRWTFTVEGLAAVGLSGEELGLHAGGGSLVEVVGQHLLERGYSLAVAESCTGGQLSAACTSMPGASNWFLEGRITYSNAAKVAQLGVSEATLAEHGAVSEPVARQMAEGVRARSGATFGISTTGIAGPGGGTPDKPVGTVHVAISYPTPEGVGVLHRRLRLPGDRARVQALTVGATLEMLRRQLLADAQP